MVEETIKIRLLRCSKVAEDMLEFCNEKGYDINGAEFIIVLGFMLMRTKHNSDIDMINRLMG